MNGRVLTLVAAAALLVGCTGDVVVQAQLDQEGGAMPLTGLPIRALPYDRDVVFDSLRAAYPEPEPPIPDSIMALQDSIAEAQVAYSQLENRWGTARDSLQKLSEALQGMSRASPQYRLLFSDFNAQESAEAGAKRQMDAAFTRFSNLQNRFATTQNEIRLRREQWADEAYASIDTVINLRLDDLGLEEAADTTDDNGVARFTLKKGQWWIHARYRLPFEELYWNVPIEVTGGDPLVVQLNRESAQTRPNF